MAHPSSMPAAHATSPSCQETYRAAEPRLNRSSVCGRRCAPAGRSADPLAGCVADRSEEHTSELQSLMRISYAVFCLKQNNNINFYNTYNQIHLIHYTSTSTT